MGLCVSYLCRQIFGYHSTVVLVLVLVLLGYVILETHYSIEGAYTKDQDQIDARLPLLATELDLL